MENKIDEKLIRSDSRLNNNQAIKKIYHAPILIEWGDLLQLTNGNSGAPSDSFETGSQPFAGPQYP